MLQNYNFFCDMTNYLYFCVLTLNPNDMKIQFLGAAGEVSYPEKS